MANLQLAHWICNRQKSNKLTGTKKKEQDEVSTNRMLPQSMDWRQFREKSEEK